MRYRRGIVRLVLLCLLLGVVTTYVSAWWLLNTPIKRVSVSSGPVDWPTNSAPVGWRVHLREERGMAELDASVEVEDSREVSFFLMQSHRHGQPQMLPPTWSVMFQKSPRELRAMLRDGRQLDSLFERAAGWPWLAVVERWSSTGSGSPTPIAAMELSLRATAGPNPLARTTLAFMPVWPGFLMDVMLYGLAWTVVIAGAILVRRKVRAAAGKCESCGYDSRGLKCGVCPECGNAVVKARM